MHPLHLRSAKSPPTRRRTAAVPADEFPLGSGRPRPSSKHPGRIQAARRRETTAYNQQRRAGETAGGWTFSGGLAGQQDPLAGSSYPSCRGFESCPAPTKPQVDACFVSAGPIPTTSGPRSDRIQAAREARNVSAGRSAKRSSIRPCWTGAAGPRPPGLQTCAQARCEEERHNGVFSRPTDRPATPPPGCAAKPG
jgi:hypothetical protein